MRISYLLSATHGIISNLPSEVLVTNSTPKLYTVSPGDDISYNGGGCYATCWQRLFLPMRSWPPGLPLINVSFGSLNSFIEPTYRVEDNSENITNQLQLNHISLHLFWHPQHNHISRTRKRDIMSYQIYSNERMCSVHATKSGII